MTWQPITCEERDQLANRRVPPLGVLDVLTDMDGRYGEPKVFTTWGDPLTEEQVLWDVRWPGRPAPDEHITVPDAKPCEHYRWLGAS